MTKKDPHKESHKKIADKIKIPYKDLGQDKTHYKN